MSSDLIVVVVRRGDTHHARVPGWKAKASSTSHAAFAAAAAAAKALGCAEGSVFLVRDTEPGRFRAWKKRRDAEYLTAAELVRSEGV